MMLRPKYETIQAVAPILPARVCRKIDHGANVATVGRLRGYRALTPHGLAIGSGFEQGIER